MKNQLIEKVRSFRNAFGFVQPQEAIHYKLTLEETDELIDALITMNAKEMYDALADRVFTAAGGIIDGHDMNNYLDATIEWARKLDVDLVRAVDTVYVSNMSKLCSKQEIKPTADKYAFIGVEVHFEPVDEIDESAGFRCICSKTVMGDDDKEYPEGKLLKSVGFKEPDWSWI